MELIVKVFFWLALIYGLLVLPMHSRQNIRSSHFFQAAICETIKDPLIRREPVSTSAECAYHCLSHPLCGNFTFGTYRKRCNLFSRMLTYPLHACKEYQILFNGEAHLGRDIYIGNTAFQVNFEKKAWSNANTHCVNSEQFLYQISNLKDVTDILSTGGHHNFWVMSVKLTNGSVYTNPSNVPAYQHISACGFISGTNWNLQYINCSIPMAFLCSLQLFHN